MVPDQITHPDISVIGLRRCSRGVLLGGTALRAAALVVLATQAKAQLAPGAHPSGGVVVGGSASITQTGGTTDITQKSGRAAIDWQSFNVGSAAKVVFSQPSSSAVALNTVVGPNPSEIAGRITANGVVAIVNQSGVIFDQGAQVDTAGLIVSAAGITRQNFMAGHMVFDQAPHPGASVVNNGAITIRQAGLAALVAPQVVNNGVITARLGRVILGGAASYTLDLYGDGLLALNVTGQVTQVTLGGRTMPALVTNAGTILADGGTVVLNASAADGLIRTLVEAGGSIVASSVGSQSGRVLVQGIGGSVDIAGAVSATGAAPGTVGGTIVANATGTVSLAAGASLNASGTQGGGLIAIGTTSARARSRSAHATLTAQAVDVAAGAQISANAIARGNGGDVTLLSTGTTSLGGAITVQGGAFGGNGGMAEVSGDIVSLPGSVNARAPAGAMGGLLIDPLGIVISDSTPAGIAPATHFTPAQLQTAGATANVTLTTNSTTTSGTLFGGPTGDIDFAYSGPVAGPIHNTLALPNGLTVLADGNINVDTGFSITGGTISMTASAGTIAFDNSIGATLFHVAQSSTSAILSGSVVTMQASSGIALMGAAITGTTSVSLSATAGSIAGTGVLTTPSLTGTASAGITLTGANAITATGAIDTTSGNITLINAGALAINGIITDTSGTVSLTVNSGALTESGAIDAATLTASATTGIALTGSNAITTTGELDTTTSGNITIDNASNALTIGGPMTSAGNITLSSGALTINNAITTDRASPTPSGTVSLTVNAGGLAEQGGGIVTGTLTGTVTAGTADFFSTNNTFPTLGAFAANGAGSGLFIYDHGSLTVTGAATAGGGSGLFLDLLDAGTTLTVAPVTGSLAAGGGADIQLGADAFALSGSVSTTGLVAFGRTSDGALNVGGLSTSFGVQGLTSVTAGTLVFGSINTTSADVHTTSLDIVQNLGSAVSTQVFEFDATGVVDVAGTATTTGSITLQGNAFSISGGVTTTGLVAFSRAMAGALNLGGGIGVDSFGGHGVTLVSAGTLVLGSLNGTSADPNTTSIGITQNVNVGTNALALYSSSVAGSPGSGAITEDSTLGSITAKLLEGGAGNAVVLAGSNAFGTLGAFSTTDVIRITDGEPIDVTGAVHAGGAVLELASAGPSSAITVTAGGALTSAGSITLQADAFAISGSVSTTGLVALARNSNGTLTYTGAAGDSFGGVGFAHVTAGTLALGSLDGVTAASNTTSLAIAGNLSSPSTTLGLFAAGTITEGGADIITASVLEGAASGDVSLGGPNAVTTLAGFASSGGSLAFTNAQSLLTSLTQSASTGLSLTITGAGNTLGLGGTLTAGTVTLSAPGAISQSAGKISTTDLSAVSATGSIDLGQSNAFATITTMNAGAAVTLNDGQSFALDGPTNATSVSLTATGTISQGAGGIITATSLTGSASGDVSLTAVNAAGALGSLSSGGALTFDNGQALSVTGTVSAVDALAITVSTGTLSIAAAGGMKGASVALDSAGAFTEFAGGSIAGTSGNVTLTSDTAGIGFGGALSASGAIQLDAASGTVVESDGTNTGSIVNAASVSGTAKAITLDGTNTASTLTNLIATNGNLTIDDGSPTVFISGTLSSADTVALAVPSGIDQISGGITATTLTAVSSAGAVALGSTSNQVITLGASSASTSFAFTDSGTTAGSYHGTLTETGPVTAGSLSTLALRAPTLTINGSLAAPGGTITLATDALTLNASVTTNAGTGLVGIDTFGGHTLSLEAGEFIDISTGELALGSLDGIAASSNVTSIFITDTALTLGSTAPTLGLFTTATGTVTATAGLTVGTLVGNAGTVSITGPNTITALGNLTAHGGLTFTQAGDLDVTGAVDGGPSTGISLTSNASTLTIGGSVAGSATTLSAGNLVIPGTATGTNTLVLNATNATGGTITETGTLNTALLSGSATGSAALTGTSGSNSVTALGSFTADGFSLTDGQNLSVTGSVSTVGVGSGAADLALSTTGAGNIDITGTLATSATMTLSAAGTIGEAGGALTAATLTGGAGPVATPTVATLTGTNNVGTLGNFAASTLALQDTGTLAVAGTVTSPITTLQAASIDVASGALITATTSLALTATAGGITEEGSITAGTLTGGSGTSPTALTGTNAVTDLGDFVANGLTFGQSTALTVTGNVQGGSLATLSVGSLTISTGTIAATSVGLTAASIAESGSVSATTLTGAITGDANLLGANTISTIGDFSAATIELKDSTDLTLTGNLTGTQSIAGTPSIALTLSAGTLTVGNLATVTGSSTGLTASAMVLDGAIDAGTSLTLTATSGTISETGALTTALLTGSATGSAALTGTGNSNDVGTLGNFTADGFSLTDGVNLSVTGSVSTVGVGGGAGDLALSTTGAGNIDIIGTLATSATLTLSAGGTIGQSGGALTAISLTGSAGTSADLSGASNSIGTLDGFTAASLTLNDGATTLTTAGAVTIIGALSLTAPNLSLGGNVSAGSAFLSATSVTGGTIAGGIGVTGSLTGTSTGSTDLTGAIGSLGSFNAAGFTLTDTGALLVTGPVTGGANLSIDSAGALTISGGVTATNVSLTGLSILISSATGSVGASGLILSAFGNATPGDGTILESAASTITAGILSGSAQGSASLVGTNAISTLTAFSAAPLTLHDTAPLTIDGSVTGSYTPSGGSPVFGAVALDLPGEALTITGTLNAETEPLSITAGSLAETGIVIAASLTGATTGATSLTSTHNAISNVGSYTAAGFTLNDSVTQLFVDGPVLGTGAGSAVSISNFGTSTATGLLTVDGAVTAAAITLHADQQMTLAAGAVLTATDVALTSGFGPNTGGLSEDPSASIDATTLTGTVQGVASLIGANAITTLGSFTATGGLTFDDTATLTILGPVTGGTLLSITTPAPLTIGAVSGSGTILSAGTIALSAGNITIDGVIDATASLSLTATDASPAGTIAELAATALQTPLLTLSAPGAVSLLGTANLIGSTGAVGVGSLQLVDAEDLQVTGALVSSNGATITDAGHLLTVTGSIQAIDTNLTAGDIAVPGLIETGTLELAASTSAMGTATGTISAPGTLIATTVTGSATGTASLVSATDANQIQTLGTFGASGFALNDSTGLTVTLNGTVTGGTSTAITADGLLTIAGSVAGSTTTLTADGIALTGTLSATDLALFSQNSITGTGSASVTATSLTGSAATAVLLTGTNSITNLGSFTATGFTLNDTGTLTISGPLQGGPSVAIDGQAGLSITGSVAATATSLTATSLDVAGTISTGTFFLSIGGTLNETGTIDTTLLDGSVTGSAAFLGTNTIGTLGAFTAAGLTFDDTTDIVIAGPVVSGATTLTAADIDIPGILTTTNLAVSTPGTIAEGGALTVTGTLSGSAGGSAAFTGSNSNSIASVAGLTAAGLTLDDQQDLVVGTVDGQASVAITDTGLITVQGALTGTATSLTSAALDVPGSITAAGSLALSIGGTIAEGGSIATPLLTGSATGSAVFSGTNAIDALGPFTAAGLVVNDTPDLAIVGAVDGNASVVITDTGALSVQSGVTGASTSLTAASIDIQGSVSATTLALTATTGGMTEAGSITAGTLTGTAATSASLTGSNSIATLGDVTAPAGFVLNDTPDLAVTGAVSGGPTVSIADAGGLTITGSITGSTTSLTGSSIDILDPVQTPGTIDAATSLVLTATSGTITETGSISTALLSGSATGDATLTGTNSIATLGDFTAANLSLTDASALTVTGSVTAATIALTPAGLTVTGTLDAPTELQVTTAGSFSSTGTIITGLLVGTVTGDASLTGTDLVATLGAFSAASFNLLDQSSLTVTGPVVGTTSLAITDGNALIISGQITGSLTSLTAATIDIPGGVTATSAILTASGSLTETGSIAAGTLALSAGGSASLTGGNSIDTLANLSAAGLTLDNNAALTVNGAVDGQTSVALSDAAALTISGSGSIIAGTTTLSAASMTIAGTIDASTSLSLTTPGSIGETGSIATAHMTGSAGGNASFDGVNQILAVGDFATGGSFALNDATGVLLDGMLNATGGNIAITAAGNIAQTADAITGTGPLPGDAATSGTITLATTGTIALAGLTDAPTILLGDTAGTPVEVTWSNNTIVTGSSVKPAAHHPAFPANNGTKPGVFVFADKFAQTGTTRVNPKGRASVIDITLAKRGGTVSFDPSYTAGLVAPSGELFLNLKFGIASGHINVAGLSLSFVLPGSASLTDLFGTIDNETGPAAAGAAYIVQPNSEYRFNSCPIQSINCILVSPVIVPVTNPVEDVEVTTPRRRRDDDDLIIPNVGEQDF